MENMQQVHPHSSIMMSTSRLFQPIQVGRLTLQHRVVMPALTRNRVDKDTRVVGDDVVEHYSLRATVPGTLLIAEATYISPEGAAFPTWQYTPGAWSPEQIKAWKKASWIRHHPQRWLPV